jgi:vacuolar-type H+-ATPase catalytic subunit A/Vma1
VQIEKTAENENTYMRLISNFWKYSLMTIILTSITLALALNWSKYWSIYRSRLLQWIVWRKRRRRKKKKKKENNCLCKKYNIFSAELILNLKDDDVNRILIIFFRSNDFLQSTIFKQEDSRWCMKTQTLLHVCISIDVDHDKD